MEKKNFLKGAAILGAAGLIVQILGAVFRIPLANIIGDEGMGYYQTAYPLYILLLVFSTNGAPAAISKMSSERLARGRADEAHRVFRISFYIMALFGAAAFLLIFFGAPAIISALKAHPDSYYAMAAIAPALLFVPIMSVFRGYFQGMQDMLPTAFSQLSEQLVRVACGLGLAMALLPHGVKFAAAGGTAGTSIGPIFGILVLAAVYMKRRARIHEEIEKQNVLSGGAAEKESAAKIAKSLILLTIPITVGVSILPVMNLGDVLLVMARLRAGGSSVEAANALYGRLSGMAGPVINIPMALALSMALAMIPPIAAAHSTGDRDFIAENVRLGLRTSVIIGVPCSLGLMALSEPIMLLLYPMQAESAKSSALCLFILAAGVVFLCIAQTMAGTLQAIDRPSIAVYDLLIAFLIKCVATYILAANPSLGVYGAALGSSIAYAAVGILNLLAVRRYAGISFDWTLSVARPLASGAAMFMAVRLLYFAFSHFGLGNSISTLLSIALGACAYGVLLIKTRAIEADEIEKFPKGAALAKLLRKVKLI